MKCSRLRINIRHQGHFQPGKEPQHIHGLLPVIPWHTVGGASVETAVGRQQSKSGPALIHIRCGKYPQSRQYHGSRSQTRCWSGTGLLLSFLPWTHSSPCSRRPSGPGISGRLQWQNGQITQPRLCPLLIR